MIGRLIDFGQIAERNRLTYWRGAVREYFSALSFKVPAVLSPSNSFSRQTLGAGELLQIMSGPAEVTYDAARTPGIPHHISLMVQRCGSTIVSQGHYCTALKAGEMCLVDEASAFRLLGEDNSGFVLLRLPRAAVLSRQPHLERLFAQTLPQEDAGINFLAGTLLRLPTDICTLTQSQQRAIVESIIEMLGMVAPPNPLKIVDWRVQQALNFVELNLASTGLTASDVAHNQRISRRRLDEIMKTELGHSVAEYLWIRRLECAAADLRDPRYAAKSIADIAFKRGFAASSHFARAFKQHYAVTPTQWRLVPQAKLNRPD